MKKLQKLTALVLSLLLLLPMCLMASAEEAEPTTPEAPGFHAATVRRLIDANLETASVDEEFYHLLANAYLADPALLTATIADLPQEDITYLAKAIAYDLQKTGREEQAEIPADCATPMQTVIARLICLEADNTANANLESLTPPGGISMSDIIVSPGEELLAESETYASISLSKTSARVGDAVTATVTINETMTSASARSYRVRLYKTIDGTEYSCGNGVAHIAAGASSASAVVQFSVNSAGVQAYYAKIYSFSGTELTETAEVSLTATGQWHIDVILPVDRNYKGTLTLYDASGAVLLQTECLGRSASNDDPSVYYGNTPTGECTGVLAGPVGASEHGSYGPYKFIRLTPVSGLMKELKDAGTRDSFLIHGGDPETNSSLPYYPLHPTHGCIRVANDVQLQLQTLITNLSNGGYHDATGTVSIVEQSTE